MNGHFKCRFSALSVVLETLRKDGCRVVSVIRKKFQYGEYWFEVKYIVPYQERLF